MTETSLYRRTLVVLGSTIVIPLIATGVTAANNGSVVTPVNNYLSSVTSNPGVSTETSATSAAANSSTANSTTGAQAASDQPATNPQTNEAAASSVAPGAKAAGTYVVQDGDTYGCIAEKYYGSYDQWTRIYNANGGGAGYGEYDLTVGAQLALPAINADEALPTTNFCE